MIVSVLALSGINRAFNLRSDQIKQAFAVSPLSTHH